MYDKQVVRRRRAALAVLVAMSIGLSDRLLRRGRERAAARLPARRPGGAAADRDRHLARDQAVPRPGRLGRRQHQREGRERRPEEGERRAARAGRAREGRRGREQEAARPGQPAATNPGYPGGVEPLTARVIARSPTVWSESVQIDAGSSDGVKVNQPVVTNGGLAGRVTSVTGGTATVTLIVDAETAVSAQVLPDGKFGVVRPKVGNPNDMRVEYLDKNTKVNKGDTVITSGSTSERARVAVPQGHPDRPRQARRRGRARRLRADPHRAVRRLQADGVRPGAASQVTATPGDHSCAAACCSCWP